MFSLLTAVCAALVFFPGALAFFVAPGNPELCRRIPRNRIIGVILAGIALLWSAHEAQVMLEGGLARLIPLLNILALAIAGLSYFFLSFLFTRALGGVSLLLVNRMLHEAFVIRLPARPLFSVFCYIVALVAMVVIAQPWIFRNALVKSAESSRFRQCFFAVSTALALLFIVFSVIGGLQ